MAVALASITPADGAVNAEVNYPVTAELTDSTDLDPSLIELVVNGVSCTVANGLLELWNTKTITGGSVVDDYTDVYCGVTCDWWYGDADQITVEVNYNSTLVDTTTFTIVPYLQTQMGSGGVWRAFAILSTAVTSRVGATWLALGVSTALVERGMHFYVRPWSGETFDAFYLVAHWVRSPLPSSGIVAQGYRSAQPASGIVYGPQGEQIPASGIVQAPRRSPMPASGVVGIRYRFGQACSGIVGIRTVSQLPASGIVYGTVDGPVLEIEVLDQATVNLLTTLGVVFDR